MELYALVASLSPTPPPPKERAPSNFSTEAGWAMQPEMFWRTEKSLACVGN